MESQRTTTLGALTVLYSVDQADKLKKYYRGILDDAHRAQIVGIAEKSKDREKITRLTALRRSFGDAAKDLGRDYSPGERTDKMLPLNLPGRLKLRIVFPAVEEGTIRAALHDLKISVATARVVASRHPPKEPSSGTVRAPRLVALERALERSLEASSSPVL